MSAASNSPAPAVPTLLDSAIDYAGLFPPAALSMPEAVRNYASYWAGSDSAALGRFVVPLARLQEFEDAYSNLAPAQRTGWRISVLGTADPAADWSRIVAFNSRHPAMRIASVETKPDNPGQIAACARFPPGLEVWVEPPANADLKPVLAAVAQTGRGAKIRTGGVTRDAFPSPDRIIVFLRECHRLGIPAKATAGLHHPLTGTYRLTYQPGSDSAPMYGFLNLFLTAALIQRGESDARAEELLRDGNPDNFQSRPEALRWQETAFTTAELETVRRTLVRSFGSCSFDEPIEGLRALGWL